MISKSSIDAPIRSNRTSHRREILTGLATMLGGVAGGVTGPVGIALPGASAAPAYPATVPATPKPADPWAGALVLTAGPSGGNQFPDLLRAIESRAQDWWDNRQGNPRPIDVVVEPGTYRSQASSGSYPTSAWPPFEQYSRGAVRVRSKVPGRMVVLQVTANEMTKGKGIFNVYRRDFAASWVTFQGARRGDEYGNYSAIRGESPEDGDKTESNYVVTLDHCLIDNCDNGLLGGYSGTRWVLDSCHVRDCGSGDGRSHAAYLYGESVTVRGSLFERTRVGHNFKARIPMVDISDSRFLDGATGTSSYAIDIPNGGTVRLRNVVLHHGPRASNSTLLAVGEEKDNVIGRVLPTRLDIDGLMLLAECSNPIGIWNAFNAPADRMQGVQAFGIPARRMILPEFASTGSTVALPGVTMLATMPPLDRTSPVGAK